MRKFTIIAAAALVAANASGAYAQGMNGKTEHAKTSHHKMAPGVTTGSSINSLPGNNDELKGNTATSAGGSHSLANTNNPGNGMGDNSGPQIK
jgi:hypothetical protein